MSSDLVSQQFSVTPGRQLVPMDHVSEKPESTVSHAQMRMVMPNSSLSHHFILSNEPMPNRSDTSSVSVNQLGQMGHKIDPQHLMLPNQQIVSDGYVLNSPGAQKSSLLTKRRAEMELMLHGSAPQLSSMPNKRTALAGFLPTSPSFPQQSTAIKRSGQQQPKSISGGSQSLPTSSKKMMRNEPISSKTGSQRMQTPKGRTVQVEPASKAQSESSGAVRSKMRESLASALAMACQNLETVVDASKDLSDAVGSQPSVAKLTLEAANEVLLQSSVAHEHAPQISDDALPSTGTFPADKTNDSELHDDVSMRNCGAGSNELQYTTVLNVDDVPFSDNFFVKDELLQGNGLTWAMDLDMQVRETEYLQNAGNSYLFDELSGDKGEQEKVSPQDLASKIEEELFKLFGGVNKKYKERGRSLLFNLKDRNNPELRERVMSGDISPEKLCSMTAEELASKELSQWRMAKAEELAQMVVLPDTNVNMRRLVRKTHKGEIEVDFEQDDNGIAAEISAGSTVLTRFMPKTKKGTKTSPSGVDETKSKESVTSQRNSSEKQDVADSLVISTDGSDLMQGMMVDEFKDAEFLPPIVSLDEFMESLDAEPPFENLPEDTDHSTPLPNNETTQDSNKLGGSGSTSKDLTIEGVKNHVEEKDSVKSTGDSVVKEVIASGDVPVKSAESTIEKASSPSKASVVGRIWEGSLQLTVSSVTVVGFFRSGEKTPTKEWPSSLEIKGRVKLEAFEKFLKELPMSRSRAVMVLEFLLKDKSSESERADLSEAVDSYISDEKLGFAEPAPGVELYLCPPQGRVLDMLSRHLSKDPAELHHSTDNALIGVVVWRKLHISSAISPNSSSHHKHSLKKQQTFPRRQQEKNGNVNVNMMPKGSLKHGASQPDDDDIPPGFGPKAARDDEDLPEFNFSMPRVSSQNLPLGPRMAQFNQPPPPSRPTDHMRELVLKYGQTGASSNNDRASVDYKTATTTVGLGIQPWNDDDDDIPEWRPQAPQHQHPPPPFPVGHSFQQPMQAHASHHLPMMAPITLPLPLQLPINVPNRPQNPSPRWVPPPAPFANQLGGQYHGVPTFYSGQPGVDWRRDATRK